MPEYVIPVEQLLGPRTLSAATNPQTVDGLIVKKSNDYSRGRTIADLTALTERRRLSESQTRTLRGIILDPKSYWNGWPKYRRFPPKPGFGFDIAGDKSTAHLLVDLQNPGWEFSCNGETYWGFNFAGSRLVELAKDLFPEYASPHRGSVWRKGIIVDLERRARSAQ
jgi:hypothetical protein